MKSPLFLMNCSSLAPAVVQTLWRYPVKSMRGEAIAASWIDERGLVGDRAYAVRDLESGHIASAKHPRKWGALLHCRAELIAEPAVGAPIPPVRISFPDGTTVRSDAPGCEDALSAYLGRAVALVAEAPSQATREANRAPIEGASGVEQIRAEQLAAAAPAGTLFDFAVLHILTTATLATLSAAYPEGDVVTDRFRPNIFVATAEADGFVENAWVGSVLTLGDAVRLHIIDPTPRCVVTTLPQAGVTHAPEMLRIVSRLNAVASVTAAPGVTMPAVAGIYALVSRGGMLRRGDAVQVTGQ